MAEQRSRAKSNEQSELIFEVQRQVGRDGRTLPVSFLLPPGWPEARKGGVTIPDVGRLCGHGRTLGSGDDRWRQD